MTARPIDENVATRARDLFGRADARLIVLLAVGETHAGNDRDEVGARRVHALDLVRPNTRRRRTRFDRGRESFVERARVGIAREHGHRDRSRRVPARIRARLRASPSTPARNMSTPPAAWKLR